MKLTYVEWLILCMIGLLIGAAGISIHDHRLIYERDRAVADRMSKSAEVAVKRFLIGSTVTAIDSDGAIILTLDDGSTMRVFDYRIMYQK